MVVKVPKTIGLTACLLLCLALATSVAAQEPPDLEKNSIADTLESVDTAGSAENYRIRHVIDDGPDRERTVALISSGAGHRPRISIDDAGNSWVIWWDGGNPGSAFYAKRTESSGSWTSEVAASASGDDVRNPVILYHQDQTWLAYELWDGPTIGIAVGNTVDQPDPIPQTTPIAYSSFTGLLDLKLHSQDGHLWTTWIDSDNEVAWSKYDAASDSWTATAYQSYAGTSVAEARRTIRDTVAGP